MNHIPVQYNDELHAYSFEGRRYTSASQLVEKFVKPFETMETAIRYAEKNGETAEYWIEQWRIKKEKSLVRGNYIHDSNEEALQGMMMYPFQGKILPVHAEAPDSIRWFTRPDGIYTERMLWHHGWQIAGRADKIILTSHNDIRVAHVEDYKTNEEIKTESYQYKNGDYKKMLPPLGYLMDCNWIHYCLQLSTYMFMLEYQGFTPGSITLIHYPHPTEENPEPKPVRKEVPYMKKEVLLMCKYNAV